jgi:hypothetical protein
MDRARWLRRKPLDREAMETWGSERNSLFLRLAEMSFELDSQFGWTGRSLLKEADQKPGCDGEGSRLFKENIVRIASILQHSLN